MEKLVFLGLGSNLGDRKKNLVDALKAIQDLGTITACSNIYETKAWGYTSATTYYNCCCALSSSLSAKALLEALKVIETKMGRTKKTDVTGYSDRPIDIDILYFDSEIINTQSLVVPHPHIFERSFVALPLAEIAGKHIEPIKKQILRDLLNSLSFDEEIIVHNFPQKSWINY